MATVTLTKDNIEEVITGNDLVLIDFWAEWCGPCKAFGPVFEAASEKHDGVVFAKVDTDNQPELAAYFSIRSIPTLMVFKEQVGVFSQPGALPANALESVIAQAKDLDMEEVRAKIAEEEARQTDGPSA